MKECKKLHFSQEKFGGFGKMAYLCTDLSHGRILLDGLSKLGSFTFLGGAFVILVDGTSGTKRIQALIDKQQTILADVEYLDLK